MKRRIFLKGTMAGGAVALAASAGLISPRQVLAEWPKSAFDAKSVDEVAAAMGAKGMAESANITIKAPDIAENGSVVPVTVSVKEAAVESIAILVDGNATPLIANFYLTASIDSEVSTRIKMNKTSNVVAVVKAGGKTMSTKKEVKVTAGGCGG